MVDTDSLERRTTDDLRVYTNFDDVYLPSVSTVLGQAPEPDGLKFWKKKYDGTGDTEHWEDILMYKSSRGTLIHYELLNQFFDGDMWGKEEQDSEQELRHADKWDEYEDDLDFATDVWDEITTRRGITQKSVLDVECFVTNTDIGYAGQFDLLYVDVNGNVTLADIKTSSRIYPKHKKQLTAYANAVNIDVDLLEVIRIHPDSESFETSHSNEWFETREELFGQFVDLRNSMENVDEQFRTVAEEGDEG